MDQKKYGDAYELLKDQNSEDEEEKQLLASTRGEALWFKYFQGKGKGLLKKDDKEVEDAFKELKAGQNTVMQDMVKKAIDGDKVAELEKKKQEAEVLTEALAAAKVIADKNQPLNMPVINMTLQSMAQDQLAMAAINKAILSAGVQDRGEKGLEMVFAFLRENLDKLADVNTALDAAKINGKDAVGVKELVEARTKLKTERDSLDSILNEAFNQMVAFKAIPAGPYQREVINSALKEVLVKFENPLGQPLSAAASTIASLGTSAAHFLTLGLENGGLLAELKLYEIREPFINGPKERLDTHLALMKERRQQDRLGTMPPRKTPFGC